MEMKFIDANGLLYLWGKIKEKFVKAESGKGLSTNDYTAAEKEKLAGIAAGANKYVHPAKSAAEAAFVKVGNDELGHVVTGDPITKEDIVALGLPGENTTYSPATESENGLLSAEDKKKLNGFGPASDYAKKADIAAMYTYKGSVETVSQLPKSAGTGDVYNVESDGMNYAWDGQDWDALGSSFSIAALTNEDIDGILTA